MTRTEAATVIANAVEADGYTTSVWAPEGESGPVRVYVTIPAANWKKKSQKIGYVAVNTDGTVESELDKQSGTIMGLVPELQITPHAPKTTGGDSKPKVDEDVAAFEASERAVNRAEQNREQG
jgi:hypothetical protein